MLCKDDVENYLEQEVDMALTDSILDELKNILLEKHPLRLTSLLYLREELSRENYEICHEIVDLAIEFGASEMDIKLVLEDPRRIPR